ncbi:trypsin-like peptidase domain-containing protein [Streptomyces sp. RPA4-5]|uniref:trypsin-like peptidase domain-containing protein n=1 Tax=Streptomyces TaxID=1883 RepID=UPI00143EBFD7|nr:MULTISPECIES: trypsin-like peptidase domain-containing protein [Streptomyces]MCX4637316.1 serine protease [Streptomyces platensis]QIY53960.1 trypsin-like peptidase domain-containing protein [Streptomyces sp. RPA4-5]
MTAYLSPDEIRRVLDAAVETGLADPTVRPLLLDGVMPRYRSTLPLYPAPGRQAHSDLNEMNRVERLVDGSVPLEIWLRNAVAETTEAAPLTVFQKALDDVARQAGGEPDVLAGLPSPTAEIKEQIVHRDDTVPIGFLRRGERAGGAVARLKVPPYQGGAPLQPNGFPHSGTGWLIAPDLLVTNHHVVNARAGTGAGRPLADPEDLGLQAQHTLARFDFDTEDVETAEATVSALVAADAELDYAVLRLAAEPARPVLRLAAEPLRVTGGDYVAVNIIQHPGGQPKRVALRNNLVYEADETDVRYFTDTRGGSSGSPVFTDDWQVVALHRGTRRVENVQFQGRTTAFVNVGTQMRSIMRHLQTSSPGVHAEIETAQQAAPRG